MNNNYEYINFENNFPVRAFVHRISSYKLHWHPQIELLYVVKGSIQVTVNGVTYHLGQEELIVINQEEIHSTNHTDQDNLVIAIQLSNSENEFFFPFQDYTFRTAVLTDPEQEDTAARKKLRSLIIQIIWEYNKRSSGFENAILSLAHSLVTNLVRFNYIIRNDGRRSASLGENELLRMSNILLYIKRHYNEKISLQDIAEKEHISYYYLSHFFKSAAGISFQDYLKDFRIDKSLDLLKDSKNTVTGIAFECGFSNIKAYTSAFKEKYHMLPSEYRNVKSRSGRELPLPANSEILLGNENELYYRSFNNSEDLSFIFKELPAPEEAFQKEVVSPYQEQETLSIDVTAVQEKAFDPYWKRLLTFGRAAECLRDEVRSQLKEIQQEIGFQHVRFHGIFNDEMMVVNVRDTGEIVYNWLYVDAVLDFLLSIGLRPFLELSFMPPAFASSDKTIFWWKGNISQPKDMILWTDLVKSLILHCMNRYGKAEVSSWYFEVWNEPDYENVFWAGSKEDYFQFYRATALSIRSILAEAKVGGPAITNVQYRQNGWMADFSKYCSENQVPISFVSFHIYCDESSTYSELGDKIFPQVARRAFASDSVVSDMLAFQTAAAKAYLPQDIEFHITEWNISPKPRLLLRDTAFMAPFLLKNILENQNKVQSLAYWTSTDLLEEVRAPISPFHGGLGMINVHGIKKPSYYAYLFLSKLGNQVISQGDDYILTREGEDYQFLCFNLNRFDALAASGDFSMETDSHRYLTFEAKLTKQFHLVFRHLHGSYKETRLELNRSSGSAFDDWVKVGMPKPMTSEEIQYLKQTSVPALSTKQVVASDTYDTMLSVPEFGCALLLLKRQYSMDAE